MVLALLLAHSYTLGASKVRHEALVQAFGDADAREVEARFEIAQKIRQFFTTSFYMEDTDERLRLGQIFWKTQILPKTPALDPDYVLALRRKFYKACHA